MVVVGNRKTKIRNDKRFEGVGKERLIGPVPLDIGERQGKGEARRLIF